MSGRTVFLIAAAFLCSALLPMAYADEPASESAAVESAPASAPASPSALSLADLDALIENDADPSPQLNQGAVVDLVLLAAFLSLAVISFLRKSRWLKYTTMIVAVGYMGFMKGNLVSIVHIFGLVKWSFPIFQYNIAWYLLMGFTVISTVFWGRLYCGRICAFGALTQLMDKVLPSRFRFELPRRFERYAIYIKYVLLVAVVGYFLVTNDNSIYRYVEPFWMFTLSGSTVMWGLMAALLLTTVFIRNFYCRYLCMVGAGLGILSNLTIFGIKRWKQCDTCKLCEKVCEWGAIEGPKISVTECVRCDDCEILYNDEAKCPHWLMFWKKEAKRKAADQT
jgi:polyferredoxin